MYPPETYPSISPPVQKRLNILTRFTRERPSPCSPIHASMAGHRADNVTPVKGKKMINCFRLVQKGMNRYRTAKEKQAICGNLLRLERSESFPKTWQSNTYRTVFMDAITPMVNGEAPSLEAKKVTPSMALPVLMSIRSAGRYIKLSRRDIGRSCFSEKATKTKLQWISGVRLFLQPLQSHDFVCLKERLCDGIRVGYFSY